MKKLMRLFLVVSIIPCFVSSQSIENIHYISPFYNGVAAIEQDGQWAFINKEGTFLVDFRNDLVLTESSEGIFPIFKNDRCLIEDKRDGISYFGFINTSGEIVIAPQYLNATNFNNGKAIVLELVEETMGKNEALGKTVVYHKYLQAVIDVNGEVLYYLSPKRINVILDHEFLREPPKITSRHISDSLFVILNKNNTWTINSINEVKN